MKNPEKIKFVMKDLDGTNLEEVSKCPHCNEEIYKLACSGAFTVNGTCDIEGDNWEWTSDNITELRNEKYFCQECGEEVLV